MSKLVTKNVRGQSRAVIGVFFIVLFMVPLYELIVFNSVNKYNPVNFILYLTSITIVIVNALSILRYNIKSYNIFLLFYFFALFLNTLNVSTRQFLKTPEDLYFFISSPMLVASILYIFEHSKIKLVQIKPIIKLDVNTVYVLFILSYIMLRLYIGMKVGFRITNYDDISIVESGTKYTIPGLSGIAAIIQWLLIILIPYVKKRYAVLGIMSIIVMSGILSVKRGDIIRIMIFLLLYFSFLKIQMHKLDMKRILQIVLGVSVLIYIFVQFGEYRLQARGGAEGAIVDYLGSRVNSVAISWLYSYFAFNFEVLKLYYEFPPSYEMRHMTEIFGANLYNEALGLETTIRGFNASTFISPYILDFGYFYHLELVVFSLVAGSLVYIARKLNFIGLYLFIATLMSLMVFGDYLLNRSMFMSIITAMILFPFLKTDVTIGIKRRYFNEYSD